MRLPIRGPMKPESSSARIGLHSPHPLPTRALGTSSLFAMAAAAIIVAALYAGQDLLIPLALSAIFSFLLAPVVSRFRRWGIPKFLAAIFTVSLAAIVFTLIMLVVTYQIISLADSLPKYQSNIEQKIELLRKAPTGTIDRLDRLFESIEQRIASPDPDRRESEVPLPLVIDPPLSDTEGATTKSTTPAADSLTPLGVLGYILGTTLGPLASAAIVIVLVIFSLLEREAIRGRILRLLGSRPGQLYVSTQALDDASGRVSRYLLMQLVVNLTYGIPILIGLLIIGVPSPFLWALLTIVLRFIPYVGPIVGAALPILLALVVDPGWSMVVWTGLLFIVVELISNNFVEPMLYGRSTGLSPLGIILSAVFWAWIWGPIGLLIATPLTVCFVVIGQYIPAMSLFPLLLGDQPALPLHARIYQRLLAMDVDEPDEASRKYLASHSLEQYYDEVVVPLLRLLNEERHYHALQPEHREFIIDRTRELIEDMHEHSKVASPTETAAGAPAPTKSPSAGTPVQTQGKAQSEDELPKAAASPQLQGTVATDVAPAVFSIPLDDESDELVARMFTILLQRRGIRAATGRASEPTSSRSADPVLSTAQLICISSLPPLAVVRARRHITRAKLINPGAAILLGVWSPDASDDVAPLAKRLGGEGNLPVVTTLVQAIDRVVATLPASPDPDPEPDPDPDPEPKK